MSPPKGENSKRVKTSRFARSDLVRSRSRVRAGGLRVVCATARANTMARLILVWLALCAATVLASGSAVPPSAWSSRVHRTARDTMGDGRDHHAAAQPRSMLSCDRVNNFFSSINVTVSQGNAPTAASRWRETKEKKKKTAPACTLYRITFRVF